MKHNFFQHIHPRRIRLKSIRPFFTFGLGIASLTCLALLFMTGLTLFLYYIPEQTKAYDKILHISTGLGYGGLIRDLHYLSANMLVVFSGLHLCRIYLTGSYTDKWINWCYGLILFFLVMLANFTGYILPWNQTSYWALKIGASLVSSFPFAGDAFGYFLLGGQNIGYETLNRTFAIHVGIIPLLFIWFTTLHIWRIRKDGNKVRNQPDKDPMLPTAPWLYRLELTVVYFSISIAIVLALFFDAPIHERANPLHPPNPAKAPWYFVGVQEMVSWSKSFGGIYMPLLALAFLLISPLFKSAQKSPGKWFVKDRLWLQVIFSAIIITHIICIIIGQWFRTTNWQFTWPFF